MKDIFPIAALTAIFAVGLWFIKWYYAKVPSGVLNDGTPVYRSVWEWVAISIILGLLGIWLIIKYVQERRLR